MSKTAWIGLWVASICAALAIGATTGGIKKDPGRSRQAPEKTEGKRQASKEIPVLLASLEKFRTALVEKEKKIGDLEAELAQVRAKLPPPLSPEEEKRRKEQDKWRKLNERGRARYEKSKELREKILQRKDKALRAQGLEELAALLQSDEPGEVLLGLTALLSIRTIPCDKERFKPQVFTALHHEDPEIRTVAFGCLDMLCSGEEQLDIALSLVNDPSPEIRRMVTRMVTSRIRGLARDSDQEAAVTSALRSLLQDNDMQIKRQAMDRLARIPEYAEEMENLAIELSKDPEYADEMRQWLNRRDTISKEVAERLVEMFDEDRMGYLGMDWTRRRLSEDARPIATDFCLRIVRDHLRQWERRRALDNLRRIGDIWVLPELEEIARSHDAEGIEQELAGTIEYLRKQANQP